MDRKAKRFWGRYATDVLELESSPHDLTDQGYTRIDMHSFGILQELQAGDLTEALDWARCSHYDAGDLVRPLHPFARLVFEHVMERLNERASFMKQQANDISNTLLYLDSLAEEGRLL